MDVGMQACLVATDQMLRLAVPDPESWRAPHRIYAL